VLLIHQMGAGLVGPEATSLLPARASAASFRAP
jgi:hypothetical protein